MKIRLLLLFIFPLVSFSQQKNFRGKIKTETPEISGILVVNLNNETEVKTDGFGRFSLKAEPGDLLVIFASHIHKKRYVINDDDFLKEIEIEVEARPIEIEAVEIVRSNITSESLGLVPKGQKRYTVAERRLYTSQSGGALGNLIDIISGRQKMLKSLLEMDREDRREAYLSNIFSDGYFIDTLHIDSENVTEFKYFALYEILKNINKKEKDTYIRELSRNDLELKLIPLAQKYLEMKNTTD